MSKLEETILRRTRFKQEQKTIKLILDEIEQTGKSIEVDGFIRPYQSFKKSSRDSPYLISACLEPVKLLLRTTTPSQTKYNSRGKKICIEYFFKVLLLNDVSIKGLGENDFNRCKSFDIDSRECQIRECNLLKNTEIQITISLPAWDAKNIELETYEIECEMQYVGNDNIVYDITFKIIK